MSREALLERLSDAVAGSRADQTEIVVERLHQGVTRYAGSTIHQTTELHTQRAWVRAAVGQSVGRAVGDGLRPDDLADLVQRATAVARVQAPNPDFTSFAPPQTVSPVNGYDEATASMESGQRAQTVETILDAVSEHGWTVSGTYLTEGRRLTVVNSLGVATEAPSSTAYLRALPDSGRGTGYAAAWSHRAGDLDARVVAAEAIARCELNVDQREVPPGEYEAIFGDLAVAETLLYLGRHGFNGQAYEEGSSFVSGHMGERVTGPAVTIWDDATDSSGLAVAVDYEGVSKRRLPLLENGVARGVTYDLATAGRAGTTSTGHAPEPEWSFYGPAPNNLFMAGGEATIEDMIAGTERGLLVTRFHYTHCPDPRRVVMTGTTRDGTFLIEDGSIVGAVRNLRLSQSIPELFEGIQMLGRPRLCSDWWSSNGMGRVSYVCPPIKVGRATFSSGTLF